jgi:AraC-like DNA-binding protein
MAMRGCRLRRWRVDWGWRLRRCTTGLWLGSTSPASPARVHSDIDDGEITRLYTHERHERHTAAKIAAQLGCSASLVYARLARRGVDRHPQAPRRRPGPPGRELGHLYRDCGLNLRDLAGHYGVTTRAVRDWLVAADIDRRPGGGDQVDCDGDEVVALYAAGWSAPAIADHVGCSPSTIYRRLDAAGIARGPAEPALSREDLIRASRGGGRHPSSPPPMRSACRACAERSPARIS